MRQQINLYQPVFARQRQPLSAAAVGIALAVVGIALAGLSVHGATRVNRLERQVEALRAQQAEQQTQLAQLGEAQATRANPVEIEARVKTLTATLAERTRALQVLQSGAAGQTTGFADRLEALARRHVAGLWLDALMMSGTNGSMALSGGTLDANIVPTYLRGLSSEAALSGTRFDAFVIERPAPATADESDEQAEKHVRRKEPAVKHVRFRAANTAILAARPETSS